MKIRNLALSFSALFLLASCDNDAPKSNDGDDETGRVSGEHTHTFDSWWEYDENTHWHESTCGHDVKGDEAEHTFDEGVVTEPTFEINGYKTFKCTVCGYSYTGEETPRLEHNYSSDWSSDDECHWRACTDEGYEDLKGDSAFHSWDLTSTVDATFDADGYEEYACSVCGRTKRETLTKKEHSYSDDWRADYDCHWRACSDKGYSSLIKDKGAHTFDDDGRCSVCDYVISNKLYFEETYSEGTVERYGTYYTVRSVTDTLDANTIIPKEYNGGLVIRIGANVFRDCTDLVNVVIPDSIISFGEDCFEGCTHLKSINIPKSLNTIIGNPLKGCERLESIVVDESNAKYDSRDNSNAIIEKSTDTLISGCLNSTIPSTVTAIGDYAFYEIPLINGIALPDGLESIGNCAFVKAFYLPFYNGNYARAYQQFDLVIPNTVTYIGKQAFCYADLIKSLTLSSALTSIDEEAFSSLYSITSLTIPSAVASIGKKAFTNCSKLTTIIVDESNAKYDSRDNSNAIIEKSTNTLIVGCLGSTIPDTVTAIGDYAFESFDLTSLTLPSSVASIGESAFKECLGLTQLTIPSTVTSIGESAFEECRNLTSLSIESAEASAATGLKEIGESAFEMCSKLGSVQLGDNIESIGNNAFMYCRALKELVLPTKLTSIGKSAFEACQALESITLPNGLTSIGEGAFRNCKSLAEIVIPENVASMETKGTGTNVYGSVFEACDKLSKVTFLSRKLTLIADRTFAYCASLTSIEIPNGVTKIGDAAFSQCTSLASVTIPDSVTYIGTGAFRQCSSLTSISLPGVSTIGDGAFEDCANLKSVTLSNNLLKLWGACFKSCTSLESIVFPKTVTETWNGIFSECTSFKYFFYEGTKKEFDDSKISSNLGVDASKIYYYSETEPTESGQYWHYVDGMPTIWQLA